MDNEFFEGTGYVSPGRVAYTDPFSIRIGGRKVEALEGVPYFSLGREQPYAVRQLEKLVSGQITDLGEQRRVAADLVHRFMEQERQMLAEGTTLKVGRSAREFLQEAFANHGFSMQAIRVKLAVSPSIPVDPKFFDGPERLGVAGQQLPYQGQAYYHLQKDNRGHYRLMVNDAWAAAYAWDMDGDEAMAVLMRARDPITGAMRETILPYKEPLTQTMPILRPATEVPGWDPDSRFGRLANLDRADSEYFSRVTGAGHGGRWGRAANYLETRFRESGGPLTGFDAGVVGKNAAKQIEDAMIGLKTNLMYQKELFEASLKYEAKYSKEGIEAEIAAKNLSQDDPRARLIRDRWARMQRRLGIENLTEAQFRQYYTANRLLRDPQRIAEIEVGGLKAARRNSLDKWAARAGEQGVNKAIVNWRMVLDEQTKPLLLNANHIKDVQDRMVLELHQSLRGKSIQELRQALLGTTFADVTTAQFEERTDAQLAQFAAAQGVRPLRKRPGPIPVAPGRTSLYDRLTQTYFRGEHGEFSLLDLQPLHTEEGVFVPEHIRGRIGVEGDVFEHFDVPHALLMRDPAGRPNFWGGRGPNGMAMIPVLGNIYRYDSERGSGRFQGVRDAIREAVDSLEWDLPAGFDGGEEIRRGFGEGVGSLSLDRMRSRGAFDLANRRFAEAVGVDVHYLMAGLTGPEAEAYHARMVMQHDMNLYGNFFYRKVGDALRGVVDRAGQNMPGYYDPEFREAYGFAREDMRLASARTTLDIGGVSKDPALWADANLAYLEDVGGTILGKDDTDHAYESRRLLLGHAPGEVGSVLVSKNAVFNPRRATDIAKQAVGGTSVKLNVFIASMMEEPGSDAMYAREAALGGKQLGADRAGEGMIQLSREATTRVQQLNRERLRLPKMSDEQYGPYTQAVDANFGADPEDPSKLEYGRTRWAVNSEEMDSLISREVKLATHLGDKSMVVEVDEIFSGANPIDALLFDSELMAKQNYEEYIRQVATQQHRKGLIDLGEHLDPETGEMTLANFKDASSLKNWIANNLEMEEVTRRVGENVETVRGFRLDDAEFFITGNYNDNVIAGEYDRTTGAFIRDFTDRLEGRSLSKLPLASGVARQAAQTLQVGGNALASVAVETFQQLAFRHVMQGAADVAGQSARMGQASEMLEHASRLNNFIRHLGSSVGYFDGSDLP